MSVDNIFEIAEYFAIFATDPIFYPFMAFVVVISSIALLRKISRGFGR